MRKKFCFTIITLIIIIILFSNVNVFAASNTYEFEQKFKDIVYQLPEYQDNTHSYVCSTYDGKFVLIFFPKNYDIKWYVEARAGFNNTSFALKNTSNIGYQVIRYEFDRNTFSFTKRSMYENFSGYQLNIENDLLICFSDLEIYNSSSCIDNDFFFSRRGLLASTLAKAEVMKTFQTMMVGFLKYLMLFLISVIAFYKGWKFLSKTLRTS